MADDGQSAGPPRKTTTYNRFSTMASENERYNTKQDEFFWLENIMRVAPHKLHSVPGPGPATRFPFIIPGECPDEVPVPQTLNVVCCYDTNTPTFGIATSSQMNFVGDDDSFWVTAGLDTGFSSGPYPIATPSQTWYLFQPDSPDSCDLTDITAAQAIPLPGGGTANFEATQRVQAGASGRTDENGYRLSMLNINVPGFVTTGPIYTYFSEATGASFLQSSFGYTQERHWAKDGSVFFAWLYGLALPIEFLAYWALPRPTGGVETFQRDIADIIPGWITGATGFNHEALLQMDYSDNYLYLMLRPLPGVSTERRMYRITKDTLEFVDFWDLPAATFGTPFNCFVMSDDFFFILADDLDGFTWNIGYFKPSTDASVVLDNVPHQCTGALSATGTSTFIYRNGYYYISSAAGNVLKLGPQNCPSDPEIPWEPPL